MRPRFSFFFRQEFAFFSCFHYISTVLAARKFFNCDISWHNMLLSWKYSKRKEGRALEPDARRKAILEYLFQFRHETMHNLATRFGVSLHTIQRDITRLSCEYPISATPGRYGGVYVEDYFRSPVRLLTPRQRDVLKRLVHEVSSEDAAVLQEILDTFAN